MLSAISREEGFHAVGEFEMIGPPLLWPEARSALHVAFARGLISRGIATRGLELLASDAIRERRHRLLGTRAWAIADRFGWSKTYDAEYLALAALLRARLLSFDRRVCRAADRLGISRVEL